MRQLSPAIVRKAQKNCLCTACAETINKGEKYTREEWSDKSRPFALRWHAACRVRWEELAAKWPGSNVPTFLGDFPGCWCCQDYKTTPTGHPCPRCEAPHEGDKTRHSTA